VFTRLHLKNFKGWEDTGSLRLAPITVLFGSNSSGKTSLLQSILLLKQTAASSDRSQVLNTGDRNSLVELGTVQGLLYRHDAQRILEITLAWTLPEALRIEKARVENLQLTVKIGIADGGRPYVSLVRYHGEDVAATMERRQDGAYDLSTVPPLKRARDRPWPLPGPVRFFGFPLEVASYFQKADWLRDLALEVEKQFARVQYVGPLRDYAQASYLWSGVQPENVGTKGENAVAALLAASGKEFALITPNDVRLEPFVKVVGRWLKHLGVIESFDVVPVSSHRKDYELRVRRTPESADVLITDVGVGVSQLIPVLVQSFYAEPGSTVIFEQPEIHLHPRVQAGLADLFIEAWRLRGVQFIVESHSEHFLRRLQRRVAEWGVEPERAVEPSDVALYVCAVEAGRSTIEELKVDDDGNITNWPSDFFGDEMGDLAAMTQAAIRRRAKS
jgi:predicted ATPase